MEKKLLFLTGNVVIEGIPGVPDVGINLPGPSEVQVVERADLDINSPGPSEIQVKEIPPLIEIPPSVTQTPQGSAKRKRVNQTIFSAYKKMKGEKNTENHELKRLNDNLEKLIELKRREVWLIDKKIELKYNIIFEEEN